MSWNSYVDNIVSRAGGHVSKATLIGLNGAIWTPADASQKQILNISQAEASAIGPVMAKKDKAVGNYFSQNGITIEGTKYMFLRDLDGDGKIMCGKKVGVGGVTMQSTNQAVIIAFTPDGSQQGIANKAVDDVAKYLESTGY